MDTKAYKTYLDILNSELVPAMGCTEPISIALTAAIAKKHFVGKVEEVTVCVSGNIIKNVKSVMVPGTGGLRGIEAAAGAGIISARSRRFCRACAGNAFPEDTCRRALHWD